MTAVRGTRGSLACWALACWTLACWTLACSSTTDSLGTDQAPALEDPSTFEKVLDRSPEAIAEKLDAAFEQLFYGDPATEAIYFETGTRQAYIYNTSAQQVRTDGLAYGMMITVQLDRPEEFSRIWAYTAANNQYPAGPREGYLYWDCPESDTGCPDPNGMQYAALALYFAAARWDEPDYADAADHLLDVMLHREELNGGVVGGVLNVFDASANVVRTRPDLGANLTTTSYVMPAITSLFAEYGADRKRWQDITTRGRELTEVFLSTPTGLPTELAELDGTPRFETPFGAEAQRVGLNLAIDHLWHGTNWSTEVDALLGFFASQQPGYRAEYNAQTGEPLVNWESTALWATNGAAAIAATLPEREDFIQTVWEMPIPTGDSRYYPGVLYLMSLMALSGQYRVW